MANAFQNVVNGGPLAWCFFALALYGIFVAVRNKAPFGLVDQSDPDFLIKWCLIYFLFFFPFIFSCFAIVYALLMRVPSLNL